MGMNGGIFAIMDSLLGRSRKQEQGEEITGEDIGAERLDAMSDLRLEQLRRRAAADPRPSTQLNTRTSR